MNSIDKVEIGKRIKYIREKAFEKPLTQMEFSEMFEPKLNRSAIKNWENGNNLPNLERINQLTELGNISTDYLLYGVDKMKSDVTTIDKIKVGKRIKFIRLNHFENKLTQEEFANLLYPIVDKSAVRKWEKGLNFPNTSRLKQIAELGNVTIEYLLFGKELNGHGERIRQIRKENNLSKQDLAKQLNVDIDYIENVELENTFPKKSELKILADLGKMTIDEILWNEK